MQYDELGRLYVGGWKGQCRYCNRHFSGRGRTCPDCLPLHPRKVRKKGATPTEVVISHCC